MKPVLLALFACSLILPAIAAEKPLLAIPGKVIYENKLDSIPSDPWKAAKGKWELVDGVWRGSEKPEDKHGAVIRLPNKLSDFVIECEFKFEGGKTTSLSINSPKDHLSRIVITPQYVSIQRDGSHDGTLKPAIFARFAVKFDSGIWHKVRLEMVGDLVLGKVDELAAWGCDDHLKMERVAPGLTVGGQSVDFRNFSIREATLNPDWEKVKVALPKPGEKLAPLTAPKPPVKKKAPAKAPAKTE